jgi:Dcp2, box A domain
MNNQIRIAPKGDALEPHQIGLHDYDPSKVPAALIQEIICRRLVNLPLSEKTQPRIMINITEAWWFYMDKYCPPHIFDKEADKYEKSFFRRVFEEWSYLKPDMQNIKSLNDECWKNYTSRIPRFGCIIFNKNLDKVLLCVFHKQKGEVKIRNWIFPKGKVD